MKRNFTNIQKVGKGMKYYKHTTNVVFWIVKKPLKKVIEVAERVKK